jgi:putative transposase
MSEAESSTRESIRVVKSIQFRYAASQELSSLFEDFRLMCNDAIRIALQVNPKNRFALQALAYSRLKEYGLHTHYILSACEVAYSAYRNKNRKSDPYVKRAFLKLDNQSYLLNHLILRMPTKPRRFVYLTLRASDYQLSFVDDPNLRRGSVTLTEQTVSIAFSKEQAVVVPLGCVGVDVNERNVTTTDSLNRTVMYDTSEVAEIKERYRDARTRIGQRTRQDRRISKTLYAKYGGRERKRTVQRLHRVSKAIVSRAKANRLGIVMEKLKGIRKLYRRGNGQGTDYRGRLNSWAFNEIQRQIDYKARWEGIPVYYISPRGSSRKCPDCGSRVVPLQERKLYCPECDKTWDRDVLASTNLMACVVPQARPPKGSNEREPRTQEEAGNPSSRWAEVKPVGCHQPTG